MEIIIQLLILFIGFAMLVKGADWFVDGSASIAAKFKIPQIIIGLTVVAMGTSAPEAAVSISAAIKGNAEITIGNIVGSNILNILIILGISSVITTLKVAKMTIWGDIPVMIGTTLILLFMGLDGVISFVDGLILVLVFISYLLYLIYMAKKNNESGENIKQFSVAKSLLYAVLGLALIVWGSQLTVSSASAIARVLGLSERFIGLTIVALGTSLPELFTSVAAARKHNADIAIGNIVGSNIFNILFVVGISGLIIPVPFVSGFVFDTIIALAAALLLFFFSIINKSLKRYAGVIMLASYAAYFMYIL